MQGNNPWAMFNLFRRQAETAALSEFKIKNNKPLPPSASGKDVHRQTVPLAGRGVEIKTH